MGMRGFFALALAGSALVVGAAPRGAPHAAPPPAQAPSGTAGPWEAKIKIDVDRTIGEIHPHLFGGFAEHLGRMIYGGLYDEGNALSDADGFRRDVMEAIRAMGITILRWPGGNFASGYNWRDGIGPRDRRPARIDLAWGALESNRFGTDEFLRYAAKIGAEPYICLNLGLGTIDDARHWVEYTNEARESFWAAERRRNGRAEPWNVRYWALGNEIDGPWQLGHKSAEEYARLARETAKALRALDPELKLVASGSSHYGGDWIGWNRTVLETLADQIDYIAIHTYIGNREDDFERYMAWSQTIDRYIDTTAALIREVQARRRSPRPIYIAYDEWNVWYRAGVKEGLEEIYTFEDALATALFFNAFFRRADVVKMANLAQLVNVIAPIMTRRDGLFLQPTYFPFVEYGKQRGNLALDVWMTAPTYTLPNRPPLPYLDVSASYDPRSRTIFLNVLNRSRNRDLPARIVNQEGRLSPEIGVWELNHPDLKATHTFGDDQKVRPVARTARVGIEDGGFTYTFPAHSLTILRLSLAAGGVTAARRDAP
ncbi:MAG TPA: alpha-L-arabinofuranosidase C-terminal domain-containing protein [Vicinamibacterales bacterium]|nr:alpha-L-arabinofuranosidase C-terminal domain-containing protein [Vicinamibacterales bacterium]